MYAIYLVCHGSHQYTPFMLAAIYQHQPDPSWVMTYPKGFHQGIEPSTDHGEYDGDKAIDPPGIQHG